MEIYLAKKNGTVVAHADKQAMYDLDKVQPEMTITAEQWEAAEGLARIIDGEIVVGKTEAEKAADEKQANIESLKNELAAVDREAGAGRAIRGLALAAAEKNKISGADYDTLLSMEHRAADLRASLAELTD